MNQFDSNPRLLSAYKIASDRLLASRNPEGHWTGELSASALSTATAISTFSFYLQDQNTDPSTSLAIRIKSQLDAGIVWMMSQQNADGGWGDTGRSHSNISTTLLVAAALHASKRESEFAQPIQRAKKYVENQGGYAGLEKRYGKDKTFAVPILANCAMAGIVPWNRVSALPFEAACVPQKYYNLLQLPVVSYAIPALVAIGQAKFHFDPPWDPVRRAIRRRCIEPSLRVLEKMMPASGGFLEAVPLTSFVAMALIKSGKANHPVVQNAIRFIVDSFRNEGVGQGSWPIDTNLACWNTTLSVNALANNRKTWRQKLSEDPDTWRACLDWILQCQNKDVHPFTGAAAGGWGWTNLSGAVPDADDTPGALLALKNFYDHLDLIEPPEYLESRRLEILHAKDRGIRWLVDLQNSDKGWPTFCRGWGKLPFDRSGTDLTAHVIRALVAWKDLTNDPTLIPAAQRGFEYLRANQQKNGSWIPLWFGNQDLKNEINPYYGTAKVILAYRCVNRFDTNVAKIGLRWLCENQNPDGGWGGGDSRAWPEPELGISSVEETALCTETLLASPNQECQAAAAKGVNWLIRAVESGAFEESWPIGFYFAKLWYFEKTYPLIFTASALGRALKESTSGKSNPQL